MQHILLNKTRVHIISTKAQHLISDNDSKFFMKGNLWVVYKQEQEKYKNQVS